MPNIYSQTFSNNPCYSENSQANMHVVTWFHFLFRNILFSLSWASIEVRFKYNYDSAAVTNYALPVVLTLGRALPAVLTLGRALPAVLTLCRALPAVLTLCRALPAVLTLCRALPAVLTLCRALRMVFTVCPLCRKYK